MKIEIVGAGVVGSAFGRALRARGHAVQWVDSQPERVQSLRDDGLQAVLPGESSEPCPLYFICVPTPTNGREQDRSALIESLTRVATLLRPELSPTVVIRSTILPGTSRQWAIPWLEKVSGLQHGKHFRYVYCPEFLRDRHAAADASAPRIHLVGEWESGQGDAVAEVLAAFEAPTVRNPAYGTRDWGPVAGRCLPKDLEAFLGWMRSCDLDSPLLESLSASRSDEEPDQPSSPPR